MFVCEGEQTRMEGKKIQLGLPRQTPKGIAQRRLTFMEQKTFFFLFFIFFLLDSLKILAQKLL